MNKTNLSKKRRSIRKFLIASFAVVFFVLSAFVLFSGGFFTVADEVAAPPAPTVVYPTSSTATVSPKPVIKGLTKSGTVVDIYIDGIFNGRANVRDDVSGTANFYYAPFLDLKPGVHIVYAVARAAEKGVIVRSEQSSSIAFAVMTKLPDKEVRYTVSPAAPTLVTPKMNGTYAYPKPLITGLTNFGTSVAVYIDGVYNGDAVVQLSEQPTTSFYYRPFLNLDPGRHMIYAVAYNNITKYRSKLSDTVFFKVISPYVAPTLLEPVVSGPADSPVIVGLAKNGSAIKVFIDKKLDGQAELKDHESGTGNFAYKPSKPLAPGGHLIYATAVSKEGYESPWSNLASYYVPYPKAEKAQAPAEQPKKEEDQRSEVSADVSVDEPADEGDVSEDLGEEKEEGQEQGVETSQEEEAGESIESTKENQSEDESGSADQNAKKKNVIIGLVIILIIILIFLIRDFIKPRDLDELDDDDDDDDDF